MLKRTYLKLVEYQTEQSRRHLEEVRSIHREMRGYKHDFHNHLQTLKSYLDAGDVKRAREYVLELDKQLMNVDTLLKTGNASLDAILSANLELSIIVGNLLDNAIEACRAAQGERFIRLFIGMKGKMLYFSMLNAAGGKLKKSGALFGSSKSGAHGFGLRRAEAIIREHGGWVKYNSEDGAFTSEFLVPALT